ncbi:hypothetical protein HZ994_01300 [Akkermansiaceae bacterium]|nr:hypothetical protein HZ994_01300 [Akkermansiaceae bacterium]
MSDTPPNPLEGLLSNFALGPAWARAKSEPVEKKFKHAAEREFKPRGGGERRDGQRGGGGSRDDRRGGGQRSGGGRRDSEKGGRGGRPDFQREEIPPAEGVTVTLAPDKTAIQLIIKEVHQVARVYPLFDVAEIILAERSRLRATFEISERKDPFFRCKIDEAIYLTKEEALRHLLEAPWRNRFIEESTIEIDPPKGNFQSVARCGISGEWLGPPNFHAYQTEIRRIHRERFPNMPFAAYQAKVRTERGEEAVNAWLDSMKTQTRWRILSDEESAAVAADSTRLPQAPPSAEQPKAEQEAPAVEEAPVEEAVEEATAGEPVAESDTSTPPEENEEIPEQEEIPGDASEPSEATAEPAADDRIKWFTDRAEFERALAAEVLEKAFHITRKTKVSAAISGKNLSPGLLVRLKGTGNHHRKHPAILIPIICQILEAEHMPVFKRKGKLFTGPARPKPLAADAVLAQRPAEMVKWIRENPPAKLEGLWKACLPEGATAPPAEYAADLFWLLQQGHILLYTDDTLSVQEVPKPQEPKKPKKPKDNKKAPEDKHANEPEIIPVPGEENPSEPASGEPSCEAAPSAPESGATPPEPTPEQTEEPASDQSAPPEEKSSPEN